MPATHSVSPPRPQSRYRQLLSPATARWFFLPASWGRLGIAMTGLGLLWLVHAATDSFTAAGAVTASFAAAEAVIGPLTARLVDRHGQPRIVPVLLAAHVAAMIGLVCGVVADAPTVALCTAGVGAGASMPQLGAYSAARWSWLVHDRSTLSTAFALEISVNDLAFLAGPALVVALATAWSPVGAVAVATSLVISGGAIMAAQHRSAPPPAGRAQLSEQRPHLRQRRFVALVVVNAGLGLFFGSMQLSISAAAVAASRPSWGGVVYSLLSAASLVGGIVFGARHWRTSPARLLLVLTSCFAAGTGVLLVPASLFWKALVVVVVGLVVAPIMVTSSVLIEQTVPAGLLTQAFSWSSSASAAGIAAAAAVAGYLIDQDGADTGFFVTIAAALVTIAGALMFIGTSPPHPHDGLR